MNSTSDLWALVLGGSSGLGLATARKLAADGYHIAIVHRDRRSDLERINSCFEEIALSGVQLKSFNVDATRADKRSAIVQDLLALLGKSKIRVLVHSIAKGNLKPMNAQGEEALKTDDFALTVQAMAISLYDWSKALIEEGLFAKDARVIAFTSEGNSKAWPGYAAVSAAKSALEAIVRNMALEFAPLGIKANCIQAGLTDTPSFRMIPGSDGLKANALNRNPSGRLTTPEDVANVVHLLCKKEAEWITGTVIKVDGGESLQ